MDRVLIVATMDTKGREVAYLQACLEMAGVPTSILDAGIRGKSPVPVAVDRETVAQTAGMPLKAVQAMGHEGEALAVMIDGAVQCAHNFYTQDGFQGIIGVGGSMGTTLGTAVMRSFPVGFPKVMISTMASRNTRDFVGTKDILMLHSVCDISGLNRITKKILHNGAMAVAGMVRHPSGRVSTEKPLVFISTLGTTEVCMQRVRAYLDWAGNEVVVFHTVGAGGSAMEEMVSEEAVSAVVDLSLHEMTDHCFGGDYDAGPKRGAAALQKGVPTILVPGNMDFLVTGPLDTAIKRFPDRPYHSHNAAITTIRTSREELSALAGTLAALCNGARGPLDILVPMGGFSAFDCVGGPLHDPEGPWIFCEALEKRLRDRSILHPIQSHINDPEFSDAVIRVLTERIGCPISS